MKSCDLYRQLYTSLPNETASAIEHHAVDLFGGLPTYAMRRDANDFAPDNGGMYGAQFRVAWKRSLRAFNLNPADFGFEENVTAFQTVK